MRSNGGSPGTVVYELVCRQGHEHLRRFRRGITPDTHNERCATCGARLDGFREVHPDGNALICGDQYRLREDKRSWMEFGWDETVTLDTVSDRRAGFHGPGEPFDAGGCPKATFAERYERVLSRA